MKHEIKRKTDFELWKAKWFEANRDIIEGRKRAAEEQRIEQEKHDKERRDQEELDLKAAEAEEYRRRRREASKVVYDLPQRLDKKWDEMNFKRLMKVLMARRLVDQKLLDKQTRPHKEMLRYNEKKKESIAASFAKINQDIAEVRARLLPTEMQEIDLNAIAASNVESLAPDMKEFDEIMNETLLWIEENRDQSDLNYEEIMRRARNRRDIINQSMGGNVEHRLRYCGMRQIEADIENEICEGIIDKMKL